MALVAVIAIGQLAMLMPATWEGGNVPRWFPDRVLYGFQLFAVETPPGLREPRFWLFQFAFLLATATTFAAFLKILSTTFGEWLNRRSLKQYRKHRVICGMSRKGIRLARVFRKRGDKVILIERNPEHPEIADLRAEGFRIEVGDACSAATLRAAAVHRAEAVYLTCLDEQNFEIVRTLRALARRAPMRRDRRVFPKCHVHIWERHLYAEVQAQGKIDGNTIEIHYHSLASLAASRLLDWPEPSRGIDCAPLLEAEGTERSHFVLIGVGAISYEFIVQCARRWAIMTGDVARRPVFHLVDEKASDRVAELHASHGKLERFWDLRAHNIVVPGAAFSRGDWLHWKESEHAPKVSIPEPRRILVALPTDVATVSAAMSTLRHIADRKWERTLVVARIAEESGVMWCDALNGDGTFWRKRLQRFNQLKEVLTVNFNRHAPPEQIAIALHNAYRAQVAAENENRASEGKPRFTAKEKPADVDWEVLPEEYRESNRQQAASIVLSLKALVPPCEVVMDEGEGDRLSDAEFESLAQREHDRWVADRHANGWQYGATRDNDAKLHPDMVGWDTLAEGSKEYDRKMVRAWPAALQAAGLVIRRVRG